MLKLFITWRGVEHDFTKYLDVKSLRVTEHINAPSQMQFALIPLGPRFQKPPARAYVKLQSTATQTPLFTGLIVSAPDPRYEALTPMMAASGGQLFRYQFLATSDELLLNLKSVPFLPAFVNRTKGKILADLAEILCPGFFDVTSHCLSGDIVPYFEYDPKKAWSEVAKLFSDGVKYRYKVRDRKLWFVPYGDARLGLSYDENDPRTLFTPKDLSTKPVSVPVVNDVTIVGDAEAGNSRDDYVIGDGFTGKFPLHHKVFRGTSNVLLQDSWNGTELNAQQWFLSPNAQSWGGYELAGALNLITPIGSEPLGYSYLAMNNGLEIAGGLDLEAGEVIFEDESEGVIGALHSNADYDEDSLLAGFRISTDGDLFSTSASGAAGIVIQPWSAVSGNVGTPIVTQPNHSYILQMVINAPEYARYTQKYRTMEGDEYGGVSSVVDGNITFNILDTDIAAATGIYYRPVVHQAVAQNIALPAFATYALINNQRLNLTLTNTLIASMVVGGMEAMMGPSGLQFPSGAILPMIEALSGDFVDIVHPWEGMPEGAIKPGPLALIEENVQQVLGNGYQLQTAQVSPGNEADTLEFYTDTIPAAGTRIHLRTYEQQASVSRLRDQESIDNEAGILGDDGIRSAIITDLNPLPRTSEDCDAAAQAFLADRVETVYDGTYVCTSFALSGRYIPLSGMYFQPAAGLLPASGNLVLSGALTTEQLLDADEQYWPTPGRFFHINAPWRGISNDRFLVTGIEMTVRDLQQEILEFKVQFGADLYLEKVLHNFVNTQPDAVLRPIDKARPPKPYLTQEITEAFLPDLKNVIVDQASIIDTGFFAYFLDEYEGDVEVRRIDSNWGRGQTPDYITTLTLPPKVVEFRRQQNDQTWYLRPVSGGPVLSGGITSRRSKAIRVNYPTMPAPPIFKSYENGVLTLSFNGDRRNIYGLEIRSADENTVYYQQPVLSAGTDLLPIDLIHDTALGSQFNLIDGDWSVVCEFFNLMWQYSTPLTITNGAPAAPYPWQPGYEAAVAGDMWYQDSSFGVQPSFSQGAFRVAVKGYPPIALLSTILGPPRIGEATVGLGSLPAGTYAFGVCAFDAPVSGAHRRTALSNVVTVEVEDGASIGMNIRWDPNSFGGVVYMSEATTPYRWHRQVTLSPEQESFSISTLFDATTPGAPDSTFDHFRVRGHRVIWGGVWNAVVREVGVDTLDFGDTQFVSHDYDGRTISLIGHRDFALDVGIANLPVAENAASVVTIGPNPVTSMQPPALSGYIYPGSRMMMRFKPTIAADGFSDPLIINWGAPAGLVNTDATGLLVELTPDGNTSAFPDWLEGAGILINGVFTTVVELTDSTHLVVSDSVGADLVAVRYSIGMTPGGEKGHLAWVVAGAGAGQRKVISDNSQTSVTLAEPWDEDDLPDSDSLIVIVEQEWKPDFATQRLRLTAEQSMVVATPILQNQAGTAQSWIIQVMTEGSGNSRGSESYAPVREIAPGDGPAPPVSVSGSILNGGDHRFGIRADWVPNNPLAGTIAYEREAKFYNDDLGTIEDSVWINLGVVYGGATTFAEAGYWPRPPADQWVRVRVRALTELGLVSEWVESGNLAPLSAVEGAASPEEPDSVSISILDVEDPGSFVIHLEWIPGLELGGTSEWRRGVRFFNDPDGLEPDHPEIIPLGPVDVSATGADAGPYKRPDHTQYVRGYIAAANAIGDVTDWIPSPSGMAQLDPMAAPPSPSGVTLQILDEGTLGYTIRLNWIKPSPLGTIDEYDREVMFFGDPDGLEPESEWIPLGPVPDPNLETVDAGPFLRADHDQWMQARMRARNMYGQFSAYSQSSGFVSIPQFAEIEAEPPNPPTDVTIEIIAVNDPMAFLIRLGGAAPSPSGGTVAYRRGVQFFNTNDLLNPDHPDVIPLGDVDGSLLISDAGPFPRAAAHTQYVRGYLAGLNRNGEVTDWVPSPSGSLAVLDPVAAPPAPSGVTVAILDGENRRFGLGLAWTEASPLGGAVEYEREAKFYSDSGGMSERSNWIALGNIWAPAASGQSGYWPRPEVEEYVKARVRAVNALRIPSDWAESAALAHLTPLEAGANAVAPSGVLISVIDNDTLSFGLGFGWTEGNPLQGTAAYEREVRYFNDSEEEDPDSDWISLGSIGAPSVSGTIGYWPRPAATQYVRGRVRAVNGDRVPTDWVLSSNLATLDPVSGVAAAAPNEPTNVGIAVIGGENRRFGLRMAWTPDGDLGGTIGFGRQVRFFNDAGCTDPDSNWIDLGFVAGALETFAEAGYWPRPPADQWVSGMVRAQNADGVVTPWVGASGAAYLAATVTVTGEAEAPAAPSGVVTTIIDGGAVGYFIQLDWTPPSPLAGTIEYEREVMFFDATGATPESGWIPLGPVGDPSLSTVSAGPYTRPDHNQKLLAQMRSRNADGVFTSWVQAAVKVDVTQYTVGVTPDAPPSPSGNLSTVETAVVIGVPSFRLHLVPVAAALPGSTNGYVAQAQFYSDSGGSSSVSDWIDLGWIPPDATSQDTPYFPRSGVVQYVKIRIAGQNSDNVLGDWVYTAVLTIPASSGIDSSALNPATVGRGITITSAGITTAFDSQGNVQPNGTFEDELRYWFPTGDDTDRIESTDALTAGVYVRLDQSEVLPLQGVPDINCRPGDKYHVEIRAARDSATVGTLQVYLVGYDPTVAGSNAQLAFSVTQASVSVLGTGWTRLAGTVTIPALSNGGSVGLPIDRFQVVIAQPSTVTGGYFYIDSVRVWRQSVALDISNDAMGDGLQNDGIILSVKTGDGVGTDGSGNVIVKIDDGIAYDILGNIVAKLGDGVTFDGSGNVIAQTGDGITIDGSGNIVVQTGSGLQIDGLGNVKVNASNGVTVNGSGQVVIDLGPGVTLNGTQLTLNTGTGLGFTGTQVYIPLGAVSSDRFAAGALSDLTKYDTTKRPVSIGAGVPTIPDANYPNGSIHFNTSDNTVYRNTSGVWEKKISPNDIFAGTLAAGVVYAGTIAAAQITAGTISAAISMTSPSFSVSMVSGGHTVTIDTTDGIKVSRTSTSMTAQLSSGYLQVYYTPNSNNSAIITATASGGSVAVNSLIGVVASASILAPGALVLRTAIGSGALILGYTTPPSPTLFYYTVIDDRGNFVSPTPTTFISSQNYRFRSYTAETIALAGVTIHKTALVYDINGNPLGRVPLLDP